MARDEGLETVVRETLAKAHVDPAALTELSMFGGRAWLLHGHLLCAARRDGLLARLGRGNEGWALDQAAIEPMHMGARRMQGWVRAEAAAYGDDGLRGRLIDAAIAFVGTLPAK